MSILLLPSSEAQTDSERIPDFLDGGSCEVTDQTHHLHHMWVYCFVVSAILIGIGIRTSAVGLGGCPLVGWFKLAIRVVRQIFHQEVGVSFVMLISGNDGR